MDQPQHNTPSSPRQGGEEEDVGTEHHPPHDAVATLSAESIHIPNSEWSSEELNDRASISDRGENYSSSSYSSSSPHHHHHHHTATRSSVDSAIHEGTPVAKRRITGGLSNEEAKSRLKQSLRQLISEVDRETGDVVRLVVQGLWSMMFFSSARPETSNIRDEYDAEMNAGSSGSNSGGGGSGNGVSGVGRGRARLFQFQLINISGLILFLQLMISTTVLAVACVLKWTSANTRPSISQGEQYRILIEAVFMAVVFIVYILGNVFKHWRDKKLLVHLLKNRFDKFVRSEFEFSNNEAKLFGIESVPMLAVCRDGKWVKLPYMHLVEGDLVFTHNPSRDIEYYHVAHSKTEHEGFYTLQETVISGMIHETLGTDDAEQHSILRTAFLSNFLAALCLLALLITVPIGVIRTFVPGLGNYDWIDLILLQPVYVNMFLLPVGFPLLYVLMTAMANSRIIAVFNLLTKKYDKKKHAKYLRMDHKWKHRGIHVPITLAARYFFKNIFGLTKRMIAINDVLAIGSITALCVFDKDGVLSDTHYVPEKLLIMRSIDQSKQQILPSSMMQEYYQEAYRQQQLEEITQEHIEQVSQHFPDSHYQEESVSVPVDGDPAVATQSDNPVHVDSILPEMHALNKEDEWPVRESIISDAHGSEQEPESPITHEAYPHPISAMIGEGSSSSQAVFNDLINIQEDDAYTDSQIESEAQSDLRPHCQILDILFDRSNLDENALSFQDEEWMEYINSLKPLGLSCLINSATRFDTFVDGKEEESFSSMRNDFRHLWKRHIFSLGTAMGFSENVLDNFIFKKRVHTRRGQLEMSSVIVEYEGSGMQIQSHGHPELLLQHCDDYWDGDDLRSLNSDVRQQIIRKFHQWSERMGLYCIALSYKPIDSHYDRIINHAIQDPAVYIELDNNEQSSTNLWINLQRGQIFLGLVALRKPVKPSLPDFLRDLGDDSGIRFIYFSPWNTQKTKDFGGKLGLETDWNSCISLNDDDDVELDESDVKAQLPHGIKDIRKHIETTDNVPLLMSLFSDAFPSATKQMIRILQENHESVCCLGSSTCLENLPLFAQGGVAVAVDPVSQEDNGEEENGRLDELVSSYHGFTQLLTFPCAFHIKSPSSSHAFQILFHLIKEGRHMLANLKQSFMFFMGCNLCMFGLQLCSSIFFLPPIVNGLQSLWLMLIVIPIMSLSMMNNPIEPRIMDLISSKNISKNMRYFGRVLFNVSKFLLSIPLFILIFTFALSSSPGLQISWGSLWGGQVPIEVVRSPEFQGSLIFAQNIVMFFIVLHFVILSIGLNHRVYSIFTVIPFKNGLWVMACIGVLLLQALFAVVSCLAFGYGQSFPPIPFYIYIIVALFPLVWIVLEELVKIKLRKKFFVDQKRAKIKFQTRLGMYSPR